MLMLAVCVGQYLIIEDVRTPAPLVQARPRSQHTLKQNKKHLWLQCLCGGKGFVCHRTRPWVL